MNYKTYDETIKSLNSNSGEVFVISGGRRMKLADCRLDIDIIKHSVVYKARNPAGYSVNERYASVVFCLDTKTAAEIDESVFASAEGYEIYFFAKKNVGEYEKIKLDNLMEETVDLFENEWVFRIEDEATIRKLIKI